MAKKAVVIGAGQAGRGYIGRLLAEINYEITFIDKSPALIKLLNEDKHFSVHFYDKDRTPVIVKDYIALTTDDEHTYKALIEADYIFTSIGEQNLPVIAIKIQQALLHRQKQVVLITCENGIHPGGVLKEALKQNGGYDEKNVFISQTAEFCSTVNLKETRLDILSQNENFFPYDSDGYPENLEIIGAEPVNNFEEFLKRKIYTYNCLAGLISYCGYIKGYEIYGEAANDQEISALMDSLLKNLNPALAKYFDISECEQADFSNKALAKFKNLNIIDYIIKNGRAPKRKLGITERIFAPLRIIEKSHGNYDILCLVAAAALCYWEERSACGTEPIMDNSSDKILYDIWQLPRNSPIIQKVISYLNMIHADRKHISIGKLINKI